MPKYLTVKLDPQTYEQLKGIAESAGRSPAGQIRAWLSRAKSAEVVPQAVAVEPVVTSPVTVSAATTRGDIPPSAGSWMQRIGSMAKSKEEVQAMLARMAARQAAAWPKDDGDGVAIQERDVCGRAGCRHQAVAHGELGRCRALGGGCRCPGFLRAGQ